MLNSPYQATKLVANHTFAAIIDEISRVGRKEFTSYVDLLNTSYNGGMRPRGQKREFFLSGSTMNFGQDWFDGDAAIVSKTVSVDLSESKGELYNPQFQFPVQGWGEWLSETQTSEKIKERVVKYEEWIKHEVIQEDDNNSAKYLDRFIINYAAMCVGWELLVDFAGIDSVLFKDVRESLLESCKQHAFATNTVRSEVFSILETLATEVGLAGVKNALPHAIEEDSLFISAKEAIEYLRLKGHKSAILTSRRLVKHLHADGFLIKKDIPQTLGFGENRKWYKRTLELNLAKMERAGIDWPRFENFTNGRDFVGIM